MTIPTIIPAKRRVRRKRKGATSTWAPAALSLVAAEYASSGFLSLWFDRAIDVTALAGGQIVIVDPLLNNLAYTATGGVTELDGPMVKIALDSTGPSGPGIDVLMTAGAATGIVAVDDGGAWAGVTNLVLPFP